MNKISRELDKKNSELNIIVPIESKKWKEAQEKAFKKLAKKLKLKGFRTGFVPLEQARKHIPNKECWDEAINSLLDELVKLAAKEITDDDQILDGPTYKVEKISNDECEVVFVYPIYSDISIKKYKKLKIEYKLMSEDEINKAVEEQIERYLSRDALWIPKEKKSDKVAKGDKITFDFKGFVDGEAFEGGESKDFELEIGTKKFIPGFEEKLIGKQKDKKDEITVRFPKDYHVEKLANKEAKFEILITEIKSQEKPKLDDRFAKELKIDKVKTVAELKKYLKDLTIREDKEKKRVAFANSFFEKIIKDNEINVPKTLVLREFQRLSKSFENNLKQYGMSRQQYLSMLQKSEKELTDDFIKSAENSVKQYFIFRKITKDEKLKAQEKDYEEFYELLMKHENSKDLKEIKKKHPKDRIEESVLNRVFFDFIIKNN